MKVKKHPHAGQTGAKRDFIEGIHKLARSGRRHSEVLDDFLELAFCAVAKGTYQHIDADRAEAFEQRYMKRVGQRDAEYVRAMPRLLAIMEPEVGTGGCDFLGEVAGELGSLHEGIGQFFTPYHVSRLIAETTIVDGVNTLIVERGYFTVDEPAVGAGGMLLAIADALAGKGYDPMLCMRARATDLSATAFQMAYLQLSFRGIAAEVFHGNTLTLEQFDSLVTPGMLVHRMHHQARAVVEPIRRASAAVLALEADQSSVPAPPAEQAQRGQLDLFG